MKYGSNGDRNKNLSVEEYLNEIKPYLRDIIITLQKSGKGKIQLTIAISFIPSKGVDDERVMYSTSNNTEFMTSDSTNDVVDELFESLLSRYQIGVETSMRRSKFIFDSVQLF